MSIPYPPTPPSGSVIRCRMKGGSIVPPDDLRDFCTMAPTTTQEPATETRPCPDWREPLPSEASK